VPASLYLRITHRKLLKSVAIQVKVIFSPWMNVDVLRIDVCNMLTELLLIELAEI